MTMRTKADKSASLSEATRENPNGTTCSCCGQFVPEALETVKACVCSRCTYIKSEQWLTRKTKA
jgi:hypothetical protein